MSKSEILLSLFYLLVTGKSVNKSAFCCDMHISERSFYRYLKEIKNFSIESCSGLELSADGDGNYALNRLLPE